MPESPHRPKSPDVQQARDQAKGFLLSGAGVAAIGAIGAVLGGAVCPVCVVAAPALIGAGLYKAWQSRRGTNAPDPEPNP